MTIPVFPYSISFSLTHSLSRELLENVFIGGHRRFDARDSSVLRADGSGGVSSYRGLNSFTLSFKKTAVGVDRLADQLWNFFLERLDNLNESFYFYNAEEVGVVDLTGTSVTGRYLVKFADPNSAISRDYFKACLFNYGIQLRECREFGPDILGSSSPSASPSVAPFPDAWAYWKLEEATGDRIDATGNGNALSEGTGEFNIPPTNASAKLGNGVRFQYLDGNNSYLQRAGIGATIPPTNTWSVSFWVSGDVGLYTDVSSHLVLGQKILIDLLYSQELNKLKLYVFAGTEGIIETEYIFDINTFMCVTVFGNDVGMYAYVNGIFVGSYIGDVTVVYNYELDYKTTSLEGSNNGNTIIDELGVYVVC